MNTQIEIQDHIDSLKSGRNIEFTKLIEMREADLDIVPAVMSKTWIKLTEELPPANTPVWVQRNDGVYLAMRNSKPLSTSRPDVDCHWYGSSTGELQQESSSRIDFNSNFSDVTVESWMPLW